jgi:hypothetical protein
MDEKGAGRVVGRESNGCSQEKGGGNEGSKNRDKKIVMVKFIIQKKKKLL